MAVPALQDASRLGGGKPASVMKPMAPALQAALESRDNIVITSVTAMDQRVVSALAKRLPSHGFSLPENAVAISQEIGESYAEPSHGSKVDRRHLQNQVIRKVNQIVKEEESEEGKPKLSKKQQKAERRKARKAEEAQKRKQKEQAQQEVKKKLAEQQQPKKVEAAEERTIYMTDPSEDGPSVVEFVEMLSAGDTKGMRAFLEDNFMDVITGEYAEACAHNWIAGNLDEIKEASLALEETNYLAENDPVLDTSFPQRMDAIVRVDVSYRKAIVDRNKDGVIGIRKHVSASCNLPSTKLLQKWYELHSPITRKGGKPMVTDLRSVKAYHETKVVTDVEPVMIGNLQVGKHFNSYVDEVPCRIAESIKIDHVLDRIGSNYAVHGDSYTPSEADLKIVGTHHDNVIPINIRAKRQAESAEERTRLQQMSTAEAANDSGDIIPWEDEPVIVKQDNVVSFFDEVQRIRGQKVLDYETAKVLENLRAIRNERINYVFEMSMAGVDLAKSAPFRAGNLFLEEQERTLCAEQAERQRLDQWYLSKRDTESAFDYMVNDKRRYEELLLQWYVDSQPTEEQRLAEWFATKYQTESPFDYVKNDLYRYDEYWSDVKDANPEAYDDAVVRHVDYLRHIGELPLPSQQQLSQQRNTATGPKASPKKIHAAIQTVDLNLTGPEVTLDTKIEIARRQTLETSNSAQGHEWFNINRAIKTGAPNHKVFANLIERFTPGVGGLLMPT